VIGGIKEWAEAHMDEVLATRAGAVPAGAEPASRTVSVNVQAARNSVDCMVHGYPIRSSRPVAGVMRVSVA